MDVLKVVRVHKDAVLPEYAHKSDAGMDLFSVEDSVIPSGKTALIKTGIRIELPPDTEAQIRPRSGLALKHAVTVLNTPGTIDEGYRGEIGVILINHGKHPFIVKKKMRIAQIVIKPVLKVQVKEVTNLSKTERGINGFGSTGFGVKNELQ